MSISPVTYPDHRIVCFFIHLEFPTSEINIVIFLRPFFSSRDSSFSQQRIYMTPEVRRQRAFIFLIFVEVNSGHSFSCYIPDAMGYHFSVTYYRSAL